MDLHIHTDFSDGSWSKETLLDEINQKDISIFSITDHDSIESVKLMETKELKSGQIFIPGVEISSTLDKKEYHINGRSNVMENNLDRV